MNRNPIEISNPLARLSSQFTTDQRDLASFPPRALALAILVGSILLLLGTDEIEASVRVEKGLQVLYDFQLVSGTIVKDQSKGGSPLHLRIQHPNNVKRKAGRLEIRGKTILRAEQNSASLIKSLKQTNALSLEAWIRPSNGTQSGPARIISISKNTSERNLTLGQEGNRYDVRLRTTRTSTNGLPSLSSAPKTLGTQLTHVLFTRDAKGKTVLYLNGKQSVVGKGLGNLGNWDEGFSLVLGNEVTSDRPWLGEFRMVAMYNRALTPQEVQQNFQAGADALSSPEQLAIKQHKEQEHHFLVKIAPLFSKHCLECHDPSTKKGGLDLSRKSAAMAGGENGKAFVPGKLDDSLMWDHIEADQMPADRKPLSAAEKKLIREWIQNGAVWSLDVIDPAFYAHDLHNSELWVQRLTVPEYIETVKSAVGVDIQQEATEQLPQDLRTDGFSNTAYNLTVDLKHVEAYALLAERIVKKMDIPTFTRKFSRSRRLIDKDNRDLISKMGKWILRGPLSEREIVIYRGLATSVASNGGGFDEAMSLVIEAMLQSPRFVYRMENQQRLQSGGSVGPYEMASRMSYILWGAPPDEELMKAADANSLQNESQIESQIQRMLKDSRTKRRSKQFLSEWLHLSRLRNMSPNPKTYPNWNSNLALNMEEESQRYFEEIVWKEGKPLSALFNSQVTWLNSDLAKHYGLKPKGKNWERYELNRVPSRGGILTQGSTLTIGGDHASMVTRGLFVLHDVLRGTVKDPPPGTDTTLVPSKAGVTQRMVSEERIRSRSCGGCHSRFEPLAFGLEKYDGLGSFREKDRFGNTLREDGEILIPGTAKAVSYRTTSELMNLLAKENRVKKTLTLKITQFSLGRPLVAADQHALEEIHRRSQQDGGTYSAVLKAIVLSELVMK